MRNQNGRAPPVVAIISCLDHESQCRCILFIIPSTFYPHRKFGLALRHCSFLCFRPQVAWLQHFRVLIFKEALLLDVNERDVVKNFVY
jgi:hypothetical protein